MGFMVSLTDNDGGNIICSPLTERDVYSSFILCNSWKSAMIAHLASLLAKSINNSESQSSSIP